MWLVRRIQWCSRRYAKDHPQRAASSERALRRIQALPEPDRFQRLRSEKKHFPDTIKLIAYRAETALTELAREKIKRLDDARSLIRQLFRTEIDLFPDRLHKTLTVRLHPMSTQAHDEIVRHICQELTSTETVFPGTDLCLIYEFQAHLKFHEIRMSHVWIAFLLGNFSLSAPLFLVPHTVCDVCGASSSGFDPTAAWQRSRMIGTTPLLAGFIRF